MADQTPPDLNTAARELIALRRNRAAARRNGRDLIEAMDREAERRLGALFTENDPVSGRPVALLVVSDDRLGDDYEKATPRPLPDSASRLVVEILGRVLKVEIDDFGYVTVSGDVEKPTELRSAMLIGDDVVFYREAAGFDRVVRGVQDRPTEEGVPFASLLAQLVDSIARSERERAGITADDDTRVTAAA
jgi:hypothetical protein